MTNKTPKKPTRAQVRKVLQDTLDLFKDASRFTTGSWGRDGAAYAVAPKSPTACRWCLEGGLAKCAPDFPVNVMVPGNSPEDSSPLYNAATKVLKALLPKRTPTLYVLNDDKGLPAVCALLRKGLKSLAPKVK